MLAGGGRCFVSAIRLDEKRGAAVAGEGSEVADAGDVVHFVEEFLAQAQDYEDELVGADGAPSDG